MSESNRSNEKVIFSQTLYHQEGFSEAPPTHHHHPHLIFHNISLVPTVVYLQSNAMLSNRLRSTATRLVPRLQQKTSSATAIAKRWHGGPHVSKDAPTVTVSFVLPDDTKKEVTAKIGESFLQVAHRNDIDLEGACEGVCACSTCHLIFPMVIYDEMDYPEEVEEDMLDMAFGLTESSRLGCQVLISEEMDGVMVEIPKATRNF